MSTAPTPARIRRIAEILADVARPIILRHYAPHSCVESTRIGIRALAAFGISAVPVPVEAFVYNPAAWVLWRAGTPAAEILRLTHEIAVGPTQPWVFGLGVAEEHRGGQLPKPGWWAGHLVIGIRRANLVVDLSLDQVDRPVRSMVGLKPVTVGVGRGWWANPDAGVALEQKTSAGTVGVLYRPAPGNLGYRVAAGWTVPTPAHRRAMATVVNHVVAAVRENLRASGTGETFTLPRALV